MNLETPRETGGDSVGGQEVNDNCSLLYNVSGQEELVLVIVFVIQNYFSNIHVLREKRSQRHVANV